MMDSAAEQETPLLAITIPVSPETYEALKLMAAENGRTIEDEVAAILEYEFRDTAAEGLGSALSALGRRFNLRKGDVQPNSEHPGSVVFE